MEKRLENSVKKLLITLLIFSFVPMFSMQKAVRYGLPIAAIITSGVGIKNLYHAKQCLNQIDLLNGRNANFGAVPQGPQVPIDSVAIIRTEVVNNRNNIQRLQVLESAYKRKADFFVVVGVMCTVLAIINIYILSPAEQKLEKEKK
jgi:hypothetical protein